MHAPSQFSSLCWRQAQMDHLAQRKFSDQKSLADQLTHLGLGSRDICVCLKTDSFTFVRSVVSKKSPDCLEFVDTAFPHLLNFESFSLTTLH